MLKTMLRVSLAVCLAFIAGPGTARPAPQQPSGSVTLPVLTYVVDSAGGLRPLTGLAGSASVGAALDLGFGLSQAAVPPQHDYLLATTAENNTAVLIYIRGDAVTVQPLDSYVPQPTSPGECTQDGDCSAQAAPSGHLPPIDRIALSPSGSAAGLFSASDARIYVFNNLSQSPNFLGAFEVSTWGSLTAFGISDDGQSLAVGSSNEAGGSLFLLRPGQAPRMIAPMTHPSIVQFLHNSSDAIIGDDVDNTIYGLAGGQVFAVASAKDGIAGPVGIAVSNDNNKAFVANSGSGSISIIGPYGNIAEPIPCNCAVTGLNPTNGDSILRLTDFSGGPVLLFDGHSATPRLVYVPVASQL
jgi:hypothetical protein